MYTWLQDAVAADSEVVTASRRLARELRAAYDEAQIAAGAAAWLTPRITALPDWLAETLENGRDAARLPGRIDAHSASLVWERCLQKHLTEGVLNFAGVVRQTWMAWQLASDWLLPVAEISSAAKSADEHMFARTAASYKDAIRTANWIDNAGLAALLASLAARGALRLPSRIVLAGFDRPVPAVSFLLRALQAADCDVDIAPRATGGSDVALAEFEDYAAEMRSAGAWARSRLDAHPAARLAIVGQTLDSGAEIARRLVLEGLAPGWQVGGMSYSKAVNVSYGRRLAEFPAIHIALLLLRWLHKGLTSREASIVLRSKCLGRGDVAGRSKLEYILRSLPERVWSVTTFCEVLGRRASGGDVVPFLDGLRKMEQVAMTFPSLAGPAQWADRFDKLLGDVHWPGDETLGSDEFQLVNRWRRLLNEFARTEVVAPKISLAEAAGRLSVFAADTIYQPEATTASVQLLGMLEAAGMQFDAMWISGLDASQWPPGGRPSPYLPRALQKKYAMPDSTPADNLEFAQRVLHRLVAASPDCVVSWSRNREDAELTLSPMVEDLTTGRYTGQRDPGWYAAHAVSADATDVVADDAVPAVTADEIIRGGSYTIQRQAVEPLAAFVYGRLGVRYVESFGPGLSARIRGNIMHDTLHNLLANKPSQAEIRQWTATQRLQLAGSAIDAALAAPLAYADDAIGRVLVLERMRLQGIVDTFLNCECERADFSIEGVEAEVSFQQGNVCLGLRVDRIDRLADGSLLIIDYKTGAPKNFLDHDGVPADLQLVVYADALMQSTGGLTLINIDSRQISYKGAGSSIQWDPQHGENWHERLASWRSIVHRAVDEFSTGDVRINLSLPAGKSGALRILSRHEELRRAD